MKNRFVIILSFIVTMVFGMVLTSYSPLLPSIAAEFSLSLSQSGFIFSANFIGFVSFILVGGVLADHIGKKTIFVISVSGFAVALMIFPFTPNFILACVVMALIGGFGGIIETVTGAVMSDINPSKESFYVNMTQVFFGIGAVIGPIIAGLVVAAGINWKMYYFVIGVISVIIAIFLAIAKVPNKPSEEALSLSILRKLFRDKRLLLICLCMFLYTGSEVGSWGWMTTFLNEDMSFSILKSSIAVAGFWASMTVSRFICGYLTLKFSEKWIVAVLAFFSAIFVLLMGLVQSETMIWFVIIGLGFSFSSQWPLIATYGSKAHKASSATVFAMLVGSGGLGATIIPYAMGLVGEVVGVKVASMSPVIFFLIIVVIFVTVDKKVLES